MASNTLSVDWDWTQGNFGASVIVRLTDFQNLKVVDLTNYDFYVAVQRGENIRNAYIAPCRILDAEEKKVEYVVRDGDLTIGDEYYYLEFYGIHKDSNATDNINDERKISAQQTLRVFVKKRLAEGEQV